MTQPVAKKEKRKRASRPKVKTGCRTCKIRHVKCNEQRPECLQCTSTGRKCDGYTEVVTKPSPSTSDDTSSPERQLQAFVGSARERRAIEFFFHRTAPQLSGFFSSTFWNGSVLQFSLNEPAIRHAMIAVSAMYEEVNMIGYSPCAGTEAHQMFALQSYNKAIQSLLKATKSDPNSVRIPVMVAIIFVCLEFLRGNVDAAITHIESGIKMLKGWRDRTTNPQSPRAVLGLPAEAAFIEKELIPMFGWLNMLSSLFGRPSLGLYASSDDCGDSFKAPEAAITMEEARTNLLDLINAIMKFIQNIGESKYKSEITMDMVVEQILLQSIMQEWLANFELLNSCSNAPRTLGESQGPNLLRALHVTMKVWLATSLLPNETAWDLYEAEYEEIVRLCESLVATTQAPLDEAPKRFSFEMGIIPPLHFVAWKCRYPFIRRKALSLLWECPRRECLFESRRSYAVFNRSMIIEEECFGFAPGEVPQANDLPPESFRIHQVDIRMEPPSQAGSPVHYLLKPFGLDGPWRVRREYVDLGGLEVSNSISTYPWFETDDPATDPSKLGDKDQEAHLYDNEECEAVFTGFSVVNAQNIVSVGRFKSSHEAFTRRKLVFSSQAGIDLVERTLETERGHSSENNVSNTTPFQGRVHGHIRSHEQGDVFC
ncbi:hypothetical protein EJ08DRAFT_693371 [Tothia fuscella]|uniref:Zn(2)-C6 fungal-type domain-containing protein n=1 Tax=Tothia fuscella TaxID=1048955 RepID=A0A9P4P0A3_9PEZI|nr:hypothetical protein EJ08DRAFT_693371 [Tothia fuscella]